MKCPHCGHELSGGVLPSRCPYCGRYLSRKSDGASQLEGAERAAERRLEAEGLVGTKRYSRVGFGSFLVALFIVILALVAFVGIGLRLGLLGAATVPDVSGWLEERAKEELESDGFTVAVVDEVSDQTPGFVVRTDPAAGSGAVRRSLVTMHVAVSRKMPDIIGKSKDEAASLLDKQGILYTFTTQETDGPAGQVVSCGVAAGTVVSATDVVTIAISQPFTVPTVMGKSESDARSAIEGLGLVCDVSYVAASSGQGTGVVVAVDPAEGSEVAGGATVSIKVTKPSQTVEEEATTILNAVYNCGNPVVNGAYPIGKALRTYLSSSYEVADSATGASKQVSQATDFEIWYGVVKHWKQFPSSSGDELQSLPRTYRADPQITVNGNVVTAYIQVTWSWAYRGSGYENVTTWDGRTVTLTFDDAGLLTDFEDAQTDVPKYQLSS